MLKATSIDAFVVEGTYKIVHKMPALNGRDMSYKLVFQRHPSGNICCSDKGNNGHDIQYYADADAEAFSVIEDLLEKYTGSRSPSVEDATIRQPERDEFTHFGNIGDFEMEVGDTVITGRTP